MKTITKPFISLHVRCRDCGQLMFVHEDNHDVVYCSCDDCAPPPDISHDKCLDAIRFMRVDDAARYMMKHGITLTWAEANDLGDQHLDWLRQHLGLVCETSGDTVCYLPSVQS